MVTSLYTAGWLFPSVITFFYILMPNGVISQPMTLSVDIYHNKQDVIGWCLQWCFNSFQQFQAKRRILNSLQHCETPPPPFKVNEKQKKSKPKMLLCESSLRQYYLSSIMIVYFRYIVYHSSKLPQSNFHIKKITQMSVWNLSQLPQPAEQLLDLLYLIFQILLLNNSVWYNSLTLISPIYSTAGEAKGTETL